MRKEIQTGDFCSFLLLCYRRSTALFRDLRSQLPAIDIDAGNDKFAGNGLATGCGGPVLQLSAATLHD
jgi:hypothetical protein